MENGEKILLGKFYFPVKGNGFGENSFFWLEIRCLSIQPLTYIIYKRLDMYIKYNAKFLK